MVSFYERDGKDMSRCSVFGGGGKNEMEKFVRFLILEIFVRYLIKQYILK